MDRSITCENCRYGEVESTPVCSPIPLPWDGENSSNAVVKNSYVTCHLEPKSTSTRLDYWCSHFEPKKGRG